jgi:quercetin dioxygenase-like cupin family protein
MRLSIIALVLLATTAPVAPAAAQNAPAAPAVVRAVVAAGELPDLGAAPLHFRAVAMTILPGATSRVAAASGILYQLSGSTEVSGAGETKKLAPGEALYLPDGTAASLTAGAGEPSRALHFLLLAPAALDLAVEAAPATVTEFYRTPAAIPDLKPGSYDLNLTRVTFPPGMPSNPPHHRSGAALYFILSGTGRNTIAGATVEWGPGSVIYEPSSVVHQWGNPGGEPLTFLAFNINPKGVPAVVMEATPK